MYCHVYWTDTLHIVSLGIFHLPIGSASEKGIFSTVHSICQNCFQRSASFASTFFTEALEVPIDGTAAYKSEGTFDVGFRT